MKMQSKLSASNSNPEVNDMDGSVMTPDLNENQKQKQKYIDSLYSETKR